jgi:plasmid maintenance system antidote protein VapI
MAQRLGRFFGDGAANWFRLQQQVDMWDLIHSKTKPRDIQRIKPLEKAQELQAA